MLQEIGVDLNISPFLEGRKQLGHSMSNQRKVRPTSLDFDDTRTIVWVCGGNNPHQILASYVIWLPSYRLQ